MKEKNRGAAYQSKDLQGKEACEPASSSRVGGNPGEKRSEKGIRTSLSEETKHPISGLLHWDALQERASRRREKQLRDVEPGGRERVLSKGQNHSKKLRCLGGRRKLIGG